MNPDASVTTAARLNQRQPDGEAAGQETHRCWGASGAGRSEPLVPASGGLTKEKEELRVETQTSKTRARAGKSCPFQLNALQTLPLTIMFIVD